jgi:hypothetical protein
MESVATSAWNGWQSVYGFGGKVRVDFSACSKHPPSTLVTLRAVCLPPLFNSIMINHNTIGKRQDNKWELKPPDS